MRKLNKQNLFDILVGATILGTGGGGSLKAGIERVERAFDAGHEFNLVTFDELDDDDLIATPYSCGAISPATEEELKKYENLQLIDDVPQAVAIRKMEEYLGKSIKAVISTELGGGNTSLSLYCGAVAGKYIIDADPAGRSVPELQHSTYFLNNIDITPISLVNRFGEASIVTDVTNDLRAEALVRALAVVSQNNIAVVDHIAPAKILKNAVINGAISQAMRLGEVFRKAKETGGNIAQEAAKAGNGCVIFRGVISSNVWDTVKGFTDGTMNIEGTGEYEGSNIKIWYKNENIISWKDGEYYATVPDLICIFNEDLREPLLNPYGEEGMNISVIVLPSPDEWTTERGLEVFGPKSFGYDIDWKPFI